MSKQVPPKMVSNDAIECIVRDLLVTVPLTTIHQMRVFISTGSIFKKKLIKLSEIKRFPHADEIKKIKTSMVATCTRQVEFTVENIT